MPILQGDKKARLATPALLFYSICKLSWIYRLDAGGLHLYNVQPAFSEWEASGLHFH